MTIRKQKKTIVLKMEFDLVDWTDESYVPTFPEISSTLKIISLYKQTPEVFTKAQIKDINSWLNKNSVDKFLKAKLEAEKHQILMAQDAQLSMEMMWVKRMNRNH